MYEKYSGLPDTTKPASQSNGKNAAHSSSRGAYADSTGSYQDGYYSPNRGGSSSGYTPKRKNSKRAKIRKRRFVLSVMALVFIGLIVTAVAVLSRGCSGSTGVVNTETSKFRNEVYVNGMNLSGKTIDEVKSQLESNEAYALNNISMTLSSGSFNAVVTGADMGATSNLEELLQTAMTGGSNQVYYTTISVDDATLQSRIDEINAAMGGPVNASFTYEPSDSGKPTFTYVDGTPGYGLDAASTIQLIKDTLASGQLQATLTPTLTTVQPSVTVDYLKTITALIGSFTTTYDFKGTAENTEEQRTTLIPNRAFNIEKAAAIINGYVLKPGETFSFNKVVGDRTEENGWLESNGIYGGDTLTKQYGGGVCQVSTTLYNALLDAYPYFAGTFDRQHHSWPSNYVDKGLDATVDTGHIDFAFTNTSDQNIYLFAYYTKNKMSSSRKRDLTVLVYGKALPEGVEYKTRTQVTEVIPAGDDIIVNSSSMYIGEEEVLAEKRDGYVVDVYVDRYLNDDLQESIFLYTDRYPGNPLKTKVGTKATPEPSPTPSAVPTEGP